MIRLIHGKRKTKESHLSNLSLDGTFSGHVVLIAGLLSLYASKSSPSLVDDPFDTLFGIVIKVSLSLFNLCKIDDLLSVSLLLLSCLCGVAFNCNE